MTPLTPTAQKRLDARDAGTYDIHIEIDIDCEELVDACGLEYERSDQDDTQNVVILSLNSDEFEDVQHDCNFNYANEQDVATALLNPELGEYTTKVTIYKPTGDKITFE